MNFRKLLLDYWSGQVGDNLDSLRYVQAENIDLSQLDKNKNIGIIVVDNVVADENLCGIFGYIIDYSLIYISRSQSSSKNNFLATEERLANLLEFGNNIKNSISTIYGVEQTEYKPEYDEETGTDLVFYSWTIRNNIT